MTTIELLNQWKKEDNRLSQIAQDNYNGHDSESGKRYLEDLRILSKRTRELEAVIKGDHMKLGTVLLIISDIIKVFQNMGLLLADGTLVKPNAQQDALLISQVNGVLKNHGLTEPVQVDAVIALLPLIFQLVGLK